MTRATASEPASSPRRARLAARRTAAPRSAGAEGVRELREALQELQVAEEELREQNQELAAARQALEAEQQRYRELFEFAPEAYIVTTPRGSIREANAAAAALLGIEARFLIGKPLSVYVPRSVLREFQNWLSRINTEREAETLETRMRPRGGGEFDAELTVAPRRDARGKLTALGWLIRDITRRKRAQQAAARPSAILAGQAALLNLTHEAILVRDLESRAVFWNRGAEELYGWPSAEALGQVTHDLLQTRFPGSPQEIEEALLTQGRWEGELQHTRRDGSHLVVASRQVLRRDAQDRPQAILEINSDITEYKRAEDQIRRLNEELEARVARRTAQLEEANRAKDALAKTLAFLAEASRVLVSSLDYETTLSQVAQLAVPYLSDWCAVYILDGLGTLRLLTVAHSDPQQAEWGRGLYRRYLSERRSLPLLDQVLRTGEPLLAEISPERLAQAGLDPEALDGIRPLGLNSVMVMPLKVPERMLGLLIFFGAAPRRPYGPDDLTLAQDLVQRASVAVDNSRLYAAEQQARQTAELTAERVARLQSITAALSEAATTYQVATVVIEHVPDALDALGGAVSLLTEDGAELEILGNIGYPEGLLDAWWRVPAEARLPIADATRAGEGVWIESAEALRDRYPELAEAHLRAGFHALAALPLDVGRQTFGAITFRFAQDRVFDESERAFMLAIARQSAEAFERARLFEAERQAHVEAKAALEREAFLAEASSSLARSLEYEATLENVVWLAVPRIADWCALDLLLPNGALDRAAVAAADPAKAELIQELSRAHPTHAEDAAPVARVVRTGQTALYASMPEALLVESARDAEHLEGLRALDIQSLMSAPINSHGRILGAVTLACSESGRRYTPADLVLVEGLARRASLALDNARLYREAQAAIQARDQFLSIASHELKTPLTSLLGFSELLQRRVERDGDISERNQRALNVIAEQAGRLNKLVGALLDISRLESGQLSIERAPVELGGLVRRLAEQAQLRLERHRLKVERPVAPVVVEGDELRLEQVVENLIQNAIKYSPMGGLVQVELRQEGQEARLAVTDHGIGIPAGDIPLLFQRFYRAPNVNAWHIGGMGVGLYVVKEIVELHGGRVEVVSREGEGATFTVHLPLAPDSKSPAPRRKRTRAA